MIQIGGSVILCSFILGLHVMKFFVPQIIIIRLVYRSI